MSNKFKKPFLRASLSIRVRIVAAFMLVIVLIGGFSIGFISVYMEHYTLSAVQEKLESDAEEVFDAALRIISQEGYDPSSLNKLYSLIAGNNFSLVLLDDELNYGRGFNVDDLEASVSGDFETEISKAVSQDINEDGAKMISLSGLSYPCYTRAMVDNFGRVIGYIVIIAPRTEFYGMRISLSLYAFTIIFSSLAALLVSAVLADSLTSNLRKLKLRVRAFAERKFDGPPPVYGHDEIGQLAGAFEDMAASIQEYDRNQKVFLQNASHELRTPLMCVRGYVEGIKDGVFTDTDSVCTQILDQVDRMEKLVNDIVYLSKIETADGMLQKEKCTLMDIVSESDSRVKGISLSSNISVQIRDIPDVFIYADADSLSGAVTNILSNCMRYASSCIVMTASADKSSVTLYIYDDGPGISQDALPHIFERFYKGKQGKFGLGLSIAKAVVEAHSGTIRAENRRAVCGPDGEEETIGALFEITLPIADS